MAYSQQIRILEQKLQQLSKGPFDTDNIQRTLEIQSQIRRLQRLEWEEKYETLEIEEDR